MCQHTARARGPPLILYNPPARHRRRAAQGTYTQRSGQQLVLQCTAVPEALYRRAASPLRTAPLSLCRSSLSASLRTVAGALSSERPPRIAPVYVSVLQRVISEGPDVASAATGPLPGGLRLGRLQERKGEGEWAGALQIRPKVGWTCLVADYGVVRRYEWAGATGSTGCCLRTLAGCSRFSTERSAADRTSPCACSCGRGENKRVAQ